MKKNTGFSASNTQFSVGGAFALLAGVGLLAASALTYRGAQDTSSSQITLNPHLWSYLADLRLDVDRAGAPSHQGLGQESLGIEKESFPQEAAHLAFEKPLVVRKIARSHRASLTHSEVTIQDRLSISQAAPSAVELPTPTVSPQGPSSLPPLEVFQQMHRQLRVQLFVALGGKASVVLAQQGVGGSPSAQVTTQTAPLLTAAAPSTSQPRVPQADVQAPSTPSSMGTLDRDPAAAVSTQAGQHAFRASIHRSSHRNGNVVGVVAHSIQPAVTAPLKESASAVLGSATLQSSPFANYSAFQQQTASTYQQLSDLSRQFAAPEQMTESQPASVTPAQVTTQASAVGGAILVSKTAGYSTGAGYSPRALYQVAQNWKSQPHAMPGAPVAAAPTQTAPVQIAQAPSEPAVLSDEAQGLVPTAPLIVEAFEWTTAVPGTITQAVTLEGWNQIQATDHWPVIQWNPDGNTQAAMISHNTAVMLARRADVQLQDDAAIVFGKIPAGWDVEYSDRAEKVLYLDAQDQLAPTPENVRYFAFLNAAPGAQVVTLRSALGAEAAAVVVPVLYGTSTYLDLTSVTKRPLSGYVLDAAAQSRQGIANAGVGVVGQPSAVFFTTESGYFHLSEVYAVGTYPVFVETTTALGFKHRYRVLPGEMDGVDLFRLNDEQVRAWVAQLEGGVSPDSGLIVAAMPKLVQSYGDGRLFPSTRTLLGNPTLTPETYTLSEAGDLQESKPLESASPRFVSVQIPTGPVISQVEDNNQNIVWSQLVLAQPGVISMVGPY